MEDKTYVYIVYECEGSYDDYWEHAVKAFYSEEKANQYATLLDKEHDRNVKFPLSEYDEYDFISKIDEIEWEVSELPEFNDQMNPYPYSDQENYNKYNEECEKRFREKCYNEIIKQDEFKTLTFEDYMKYNYWFDTYRYKDYKTSKVERVEIEN